MMMKVVILVPLAITASVLAIVGLGIVSQTPTARVGVHSLLAYWISIPAAVGVLTIRERPTTSHVVFNSALLFTILIHIGSAIQNLLAAPETIVQRQPVSIVADLMEFALLGIVLAAALIILESRRDSDGSSASTVFAMLLVFLPLAVYGAVWYILIRVLPEFLLMVTGIVVCALAVVAFAVAAYLSPKLREAHLPADPGFFASGIILMAVSSVLLLASLFTQSPTWIYAETVQGAAFLMLGISVGVPYLKRTGLPRRSTYTLVTVLALLAYIPFLITTLIESTTPNIVYVPENQLVNLIIHVGAGSLSAMMTYLLYAFMKRRTAWTLFPFILLFGLWTGVSVVSISTIIFPFLTPLGEPIIPYVVGSIMALVLLFYSVKWTEAPPKTEFADRPAIKLALGILLLSSAVVLGEVGNQLYLRSYPAQSGSPIGNSLLLGTNLIVMFAFAYLVFFLTGRSGGRIPLEVYVAYFLSLWIVPNILKSYYDKWSAGWWVSELLIFIGLLIGPALLALLYVRAMREAEDSHSRASLYADLLMHDITNYNQMTMTALELLGAEGVLDEVRGRLARDARQILQLSEQMIANVRLLTKTEELPSKPFEPTDLVLVVVGALDEVTQEIGSENVGVHFTPVRHRAFVMANEYLIHVFVNLLINVLQHPPEEKTISVEVAPHTEDGVEWWQVRFGVPGRWIEHGSRPTLFDREVGSYSGSALGLLVARLLAESYGGSVTMEDRIMGEFFKGTVFVVSLPASDKPEL
jgi:signal transduction histidine kinase